jgi:hypothetical protein
MCRYISSIFIFLFSIMATSASWADTELLMAEEPGCIWCARWNTEIGPIYPKTGEGAAAPLRRVDITEPKPDDITLARAVNFTPTFILLVNGTEVARIEGYPGEDFFWGLLGQMLTDKGIPFETGMIQHGVEQ